MAISNEEFKAALGRFASGVTVVTTKDNAGKLHGLTVSAFSSVSMNPPLVLICIQNSTPSYYAFGESKVFAVNILSESQQEVSNRFAFKHEDKFAGIKFDLTENGLPLLQGCLVNLECNLKHSYDGGDHTIFIGAVEKVKIASENPLVYFHGKYRSINDLR